MFYEIVVFAAHLKAFGLGNRAQSGLKMGEFIERMCNVTLSNYSAWRLKSRLRLRSLPSQAETQSPKGDFAMVGAVSTAGIGKAE